MINPSKDSHLQLHNTFNEYHNALSHIMPLFYTDNSATYKKDSNSYEKNIKKAMSHLVRGTLDSCKSIIDFNMKKIIADENLLNSYQELRKKELYKIGFIDDSVHKNSHKNIVIEYMKYVNRLQK